VIEQVFEPGVASPCHVHRNEVEEFYVIEGQLRFVSEGRSWIAGPGTFAVLPRNVPHGIEVIGETPARELLMVTPGGFDNFVAELSEDVPGLRNMEKVMSTTPRYRFEILGSLT